MQVRESTTLASALLEWAYHEATGMFSAQLADQQELLRSRTEDADLLAMGVFLRTRWPLLAKILCAEPVRVMRVAINPGDVPRLAVLEHDLSSFALAGSPDPKGEEHIRRLETLEEVPGPLLAVGPSESGPLCIVDGLHRACAWARHVDKCRRYSIDANVIVTAKPTWYEVTRFPDARKP